MNGPTAAVVILFLLMCVKHLLLSLTPLLRYHTHTHARAHTHTVFWWLAIVCLALTYRQGLDPCLWCLVAMVAAQPVE